MGDSDLNDGEWVWPQRLEHYIEEHDLRLPDEFVEAMRRNGWQVLGGPSRPFEGWQEPDYTFWMTWAAAVKDDRST